MKCPGQDWMYWKEDAIFEISCPFCGSSIEFFKDDTIRKCPKCKKTVPNPRMDFGCAAYCKYAEVCLGELPPELIKEKVNLLKTRILKTLQEFLPKEILEEIKREGEILEEKIKEKKSSPGSKLLIWYFYFLPPEKRIEFYKKINLPEHLEEEIREELRKLPESLNKEDLKNLLLKQI